MKKNDKTEWQRMIDGKLYNSTHKDFILTHAKGMYTCQRLNRTPVWNVLRQQRLIHKLIPSSKGKSVFIFTPFYCEYGVNITLGTDIFMNYGCTLLDCAPITLEDGVWLGANVTIATPMHPLLASERISQQYPDGFHDLEYTKPVTVKKGTWIASCATICGGVTIGENCVVAAGAVVTKDMPANSLIAGVPAKVLRTFDDDDKIDVWDTYIKDEMPLSKRNKQKLL